MSNELFGNLGASSADTNAPVKTKKKTAAAAAPAPSTVETDETVPEVIVDNRANAPTGPMPSLDGSDEEVVKDVNDIEDDEPSDEIPADEQEVPEEEDEDAPLPIKGPSELEVLRKRAKTLKVKFTDETTLEQLRESVRRKQEGEPDEDAPAVTTPSSNKVKTQSLRKYVQSEGLKLIRVKISSMDGKKKDLKGEFFTVANSHLGKVSKFIPYNRVTMVPAVLLKMIRRKKFLEIRETKSGDPERTWVKEYSIDTSMGQPTMKEIADLKAAQAAKGGVSDE